jgi:glycosyltransferase involved in cell wall biosynthesis
MKFSIISCSRNNEKWLQKHIESVATQSFNDYEHIIIDDASTDESVNVIKNFADRTKTKVFIRKERSFALKNHILGLKKASGEIIIHLDGDDWFYDSEVLQHLANVYETEKCIATYGSWVDVLNPKNIQTYKHPTHKAIDVRKNRHWYFTHLRTFKRELASAINGMDLFDDEGNINDIGADAALLTSIYEYALHTGKVIYIDKPLMYYNSSTGNNDCVVNLQKHIKTASSILNSKYTMCNLWK